MSADSPSVLTALLSRQSVPALRLRAPAPAQEQIDAALEAALRAPDHGALRPWRFTLIRGEARARLAQLFERRMLERNAEVEPGKIDKARARLSAAPLVIAIGARILSGHSVPEIEQLLAVGAGVMNLLNVFHALGFGAIWLTGENAYDPQIAQALGFGAAERCLGFVYVGSIEPRREGPAGAPAQLPGVRRPSLAAHVREWTGP